MLTVLFVSLPFYLFYFQNIPASRVALATSNVEYGKKFKKEEEICVFLSSDFNVF